MTALRPLHRLLAVVLAAATALPAPAVAAPAEPAPMDPQAKAHLDRALELYQKGEHAAAIEEFKAGYAIDPRRDFLFAWAQSERQNGDCVTANELYKRFIAERPPDVQVAAAEKGIEICDKELADKRNAPVGPTPEEVAAAEQARQQAEEEQRRAAEEEQRREAEEAAAAERARRFYLDPLGDGLVAGGLVAAITGGALLTVAQVKVQNLADAPTYGDFAADRDAVAAQSRTFRITGGVLIGVGAALVAGGVARWMIVRSGGGKRERPSAWIAPQMTGVALGGRF